MALICAVAEKGGVGKTTILALLAERFLALGLPVKLADSDRQASLSAQAERSNGLLPPCAETFPRSFPKLAQESGLVLLDTPSGLGMELRAALAVADLALVPVTPSAYDVRTLPATLDAITGAVEARAGTGTPKALLVLNRVAVREANSRKLLSVIRDMGWPVARTALPERSAFKRFGESALGALPTSTRRSVERAVAELADEVLEAVGMGVTEGTR
jgi:chromosome partitioning protein